MTGDAIPTELGAGDHEERPASLERRHSLVKLALLQKKVSQSPFHNQSVTHNTSASDCSASDGNSSQLKQGGDPLDGPFAAATRLTDSYQPHQRQDGVGGDLARRNPFYTYYMESNSKDVGRKSSDGDVGKIVSSPEFQSSPPENQTEIKSAQNGTDVSAPLKDLFQMSTLPQNPTTNFHNVTLNSSDLFNPVSAQTQNLSKSSDLFKTQGLSYFRATNGDAEPTSELFETSPWTVVDPFMSPSKMEGELFQSPQLVVTNPFHKATTSGTDLFQGIKPDPPSKDDVFGLSSPPEVDIFSPSSADTPSPFPSAVTRDLFQDFSSSEDAYPTSTSTQCNLLENNSKGTLDIFQPLPKNIYDTAPKKSYPTPSLNSPLETQLDTPDLFKTTPPHSPPSNQPQLLDKTLNTFLTPQGTKHTILQPTPLIQATCPSVSPGQSSPEVTHVSPFTRPPKPLPRRRQTRREKPSMAEKLRFPGKPPVPRKSPLPEKPPVPEKPLNPQKSTVPENVVEPESAVQKTFPKPTLRTLPKPVIPRKPKTSENKQVNPENYVVFQDILLTGQEKCVEDWPEDSPELNPNFKPSGTFRLRRESLKKAELDGEAGDDNQDGSESHKKKDKRFRKSLLSRRGSKERFTDDAKEEKSSTLPASTKLFKDNFSDLHVSAGENDDGDYDGVEYKKKKLLKTKVSQLLRRASTSSLLPEGKRMNELQESKDGDLKKNIGKEGSSRRWSEGTVLDESTGEEEEGGEAQHEQKRKKKVRIRFVPHRGFAISLDKDDERKGAHGYTPSKGSKEDAFEDVAELKAQIHSASKASFRDEEHFQKTPQTSAGWNGDQHPYGTEDCKPKKPTKLKLPQLGRRSSKDDMLDDSSTEKQNFSVEDLDDDKLNKMEDYKLRKSKLKGPVPTSRKSKTGSDQGDPFGFSPNSPQQASNETFDEDDMVHTGKSFVSPGEMYDLEEDEPENPRQKKLSKLKGLKKHKTKSKKEYLHDPPGATSSNLSEAAKAEWRAAQMDGHAMADLGDEEEEGDTDSLMEWWYTVEQWDELPSDEEDRVTKEDESRSFTTLANKVHRGLRVFNKVFTERAEVLWQYVIALHAIADNISEFHQKAKIAGITGGTTTAVGGVTAIAGLVLAPFTLGASLVMTAVGVGVATAGGIASASAAISDNINNMHDRKKVEVVLQEYEAHLLVIAKILHFVDQGLYRLRGHPFLRSGTQHYSEDWEIRKAVQMISLVDAPVMRAVEITDSAIASVKGLFKGMDKYFLKDSRELKKGCKKEVVAQIKVVANLLNDATVSLNTIREELHDATGSI